MKPAPFDYLRATSVTEAVRALADADGDGKIIAGGQSLVPVLALRLATPALLVDVNRVPGLATIAVAGSTVRVGALVRHARLVEQSDHPLLAEAAGWIGHTAIRSRGTCGGSIAHADPAAELPVVAVALAATVHVAGPAGTRDCAAGDFFVGPLTTTLADDEMITGVDLPVPSRWGFAELSRRHGDFGLVTVVVAEVEGHWRIAVGGVGGVPCRPAAAEALLAGGAPPQAVADAVEADIEPTGDLHGSAAYRRAMAAEFTRRAVATAIGRGAA
jgi:carbon-monoxide dehydrogenase medium subunit